MAEKLFDNNFNSTELTKINININDAFSSKDDELHHIRIQCQEFMLAQGYDDFIFVKYTHKKQLNSLATNKIFFAVMNEFKQMLSPTEVFSIMCDHFEINEKELYDQLAEKAKNILKEELIKHTKYKKKDFLEKSTTGYFMPSL